MRTKRRENAREKQTHSNSNAKGPKQDSRDKVHVIYKPGFLTPLPFFFYKTFVEQGELVPESGSVCRRPKKSTVHNLFGLPLQLRTHSGSGSCGRGSCWCRGRCTLMTLTSSLQKPT